MMILSFGQSAISDGLQLQSGCFPACRALLPDARRYDDWSDCGHRRLLSSRLFPCVKRTLPKELSLKVTGHLQTQLLLVVWRREQPDRVNEALYRPATAAVQFARNQDVACGRRGR